MTTREQSEKRNIKTPTSYLDFKKWNSKYADIFKRYSLLPTSFSSQDQSLAKIHFNQSMVMVSSLHSHLHYFWQIGAWTWQQFWSVNVSFSANICLKNHQKLFTWFGFLAKQCWKWDFREFSTIVSYKEILQKPIWGDYFNSPNLLHFNQFSLALLFVTLRCDFKATIDLFSIES